MPSFAGQIPEEDLLKLIAYIKSIGRGRPTRPLQDRGMEPGEGAVTNITEITGMSQQDGGDAR
jgi:hypothetical protein